MCVISIAVINIPISLSLLDSSSPITFLSGTTIPFVITVTVVQSPMLSLLSFSSRTSSPVLPLPLSLLLSPLFFNPCHYFCHHFCSCCCKYFTFASPCLHHYHWCHCPCLHLRVFRQYNKPSNVSLSIRFIVWLIFSFVEWRLHSLARLSLLGQYPF